MNTFKKKSLHVALAGLGTLSLAGAADAVMVNPNGLGQVLIYPYYTVRSIGPGGLAVFNTLLSIVNTTNSVKAVKVRFKEGKASKEVLDFNVFLSPQDMWTAAVEPDGAGGAQIETADKSCTIPTFTGPVAFRTSAYASDPIGGGPDRLTEGYFEVFEMATYASSDPVAVGATHVAGVPKDCSAVTDSTAAATPLAPNGGLAGSASLINVLSGSDFAEDATALTQFWDPAVLTGSYSTTGDLTPTYSSALNFGAAVDGLGNIVTAVFPTGTQAVTAALQKQEVANTFILDKNTASGTDWVLTFPTKGDHVTTSKAIPPFVSPLGKTGSCDGAVVTTYDREESKITPGGPDFSPTPTPTGFALCWEANIISFKDDLASGVFNVLGSANSYVLNTTFENGWGNVIFGLPNGKGGITEPSQQGTSPVGFDPTQGTTFTNSTTFSGLPTIGFAAQTFVNGTLTDGAGKLVQSNYGQSFKHFTIGPQ